MLEASILVIFPFCMVFAAISDMLSMTIANRVPALLVVAFAVIGPMTGMDWQTFGWHFAAGGIVLAATFALFAVGGMGGGDAKLLAATSLWFGMSLELLSYLVAATFLGGLLTIAILALRKSPLVFHVSDNLFLRNLADERLGVPYGIALGIGGLLTYPSSPPMAWALGRLAGH
ncbi:MULTISPECIES: A24 family peptidase [unclassified Mesorhizobium]|uniref:A24 family peptidase n=1 Tax=unclassified Mesorhizobium TaxID=325217 RepID=UPI001926AEF2|nr:MULTISPECIES: prepilin peptidase [unclassified Mesorhizobium]BCH28061.1 peptidase [Mesorhizobium sp. L-8-3]